MTRKTTPPDAKLSDSIKRALEAASAATDSAEEAATVSETAEKALLASAAAQKRVTALAGGSLVAAVAIAGLGTMVYLRSVADLREAAEIQSAANKAMVEQVQNLTLKLTEAEAVLQGAETLRDEVSARIDGLGDRMAAEMKSALHDAGQMQPQMAASIQSHMDDALNQMRGEILAAMAEFEVDGISGAEVQGLREALSEIKALMAKGSSTSAPSRASASSTPKPKARQKSTSAAAPSKPPFSYP